MYELRIPQFTAEASLVDANKSFEVSELIITYEYFLPSLNIGTTSPALSSCQDCYSQCGNVVDCGDPGLCAGSQDSPQCIAARARCEQYNTHVLSCQHNCSLACCNQLPHHKICTYGIPPNTTQQCVDITTLTDCGDCGIKCGPLSECAQNLAICTASGQPTYACFVDNVPGVGTLNPCPPGSTRCLPCVAVGSIVPYCAELDKDPANCGDCGNFCNSENCTNGVCMPCPSGKTECPRGSGQCCGQDQDRCNNQCTDTQHDRNNCGGCGIICAANQYCEAPPGTAPGDGCKGCAPGETVCGGVCVNTQTDNNNCVACGVSCSNALPGSTSQSGSCQCAGGLTKCRNPTNTGWICVDTKSDPNNCNGCGMS